MEQALGRVADARNYIGSEKFVLSISIRILQLQDDCTKIEVIFDNFSF